MLKLQWEKSFQPADPLPGLPTSGEQPSDACGIADVEQPDSRRMPDTGDAAERPHGSGCKLRSGLLRCLQWMKSLWNTIEKNIYIYIYCFMILTHYHLPITNGIIVIISMNHYYEPVLIIVVLSTNQCFFYQQTIRISPNLG